MARRSKKQIHVNRHMIAADLKTWQVSPAITVQQSGRKLGNAHQVDILKDGEVVASIVYRPESPLHCGARAWIQTDHEIRLITHPS